MTDRKTRGKVNTIGDLESFEVTEPKVPFRNGVRLSNWGWRIISLRFYSTIDSSVECLPPFLSLCLSLCLSFVLSSRFSRYLSARYLSTFLS